MNIDTIDISDLLRSYLVGFYVILPQYNSIQQEFQKDT